MQLAQCGEPAERRRQGGEPVVGELEHDERAQVPANAHSARGSGSAAVTSCSAVTRIGRGRIPRAPDAGRLPAVNDRLHQIAEGVLQVPLHRALGVRLADPARPDRGLEVDVVDLMTNNVGVLHGGLVPTLLDVASYLAVAGTLEEGTNAVTISSTASLLRSVPAGATLRFVGEVGRRGRTMAFLTAEAWQDDRLVATGQVVKAVVPLG